MGLSQRVHELWRFREVIRNFVAQDLKVKYRRSSLGFFWSLLNPLLMMAVLSLVFVGLFRFGKERYTLYLLSGTLPWTFFAATIEGCSASILGNESYLKRQYFPKLVFPLSIVGQHLVTLVLSMLVLLSTLGYFIGFHPTRALLFLPFAVVCLTAAALGLGAVIAVITVYFRDVQHLIQVAMFAWYFLTPVIWPLEDQKPEWKQFYFKLNPMYSLLTLFRDPIYEAAWPQIHDVLYAGTFSLFCLMIGLAVFWRREDDLIYRL